MSNYVTLLGYEDVARAGHNISAAAESISRTFNYCDEAMRTMVRQMETLTEELSALREVVSRIPIPAPQSEKRCSLCGATRVRHDDGTFGACTLIGCNNPLHDYDREQSSKVKP